MSDTTITPSEIEMIAYNAGYRAGIAEREAEAAKWSVASLEWNALVDGQVAEIQGLNDEIAASAVALEEGTRHSIALQADVAKWKAAAEAWTVMVDEQADQIRNLQADIQGLKTQIKGFYDGLDEARDEQTRLSNELMDVLDEKHEALKLAATARGIMEKLADDLESSKYTFLLGQEIRNRWKTAMNSDLASTP